MGETFLVAWGKKMNPTMALMIRLSGGLQGEGKAVVEASEINLEELLNILRSGDDVILRGEERSVAFTVSHVGTKTYTCEARPVKFQSMTVRVWGKSGARHPFEFWVKNPRVGKGEPQWWRREMLVTEVELVRPGIFQKSSERQRQRKSS